MFILLIGDGLAAPKYRGEERFCFPGWYCASVGVERDVE